MFYSGQPKECRKCGSLDHLAVNCEMEVCRHCKSREHSSKECPLPRKCNLCGAETHRFRDCPQAYSNKMKQQSCREAGNSKDSSNATADINYINDQQYPLQDGTDLQEKGAKNSVSQIQDGVKTSTPTTQTNELAPSQDHDSVPAVNNETFGDQHKGIASFSRLEGEIDLMLSSPDNGFQKPKGNILLEGVEVFPLSLTLLSEKSSSSSSSLDNDNQLSHCLAG